MALGQGAWLGGIALTIWTATTALRAKRGPALAWAGLALAAASVAAVFLA
jgi:hypothetical protein